MNLLLMRLTVDPNHSLYLLDMNDKIIGLMHFVVMPSISRHGMKRAQIESVRIHSDYRRKGFGKQLTHFGLKKAMENGCGLVQLTTDKSRKSARALYLSMGFTDHHVGMKINL